MSKTSQRKASRHPADVSGFGFYWRRAEAEKAAARHRADGRSAYVIDIPWAKGCFTVRIVSEETHDR